MHARRAQDAKEVFLANLRALMASRKDRNTQTKVAEACGLSQTYIGKLLRREQGPSVEAAGQIAGAFGLEAWHMLVPNLDPKNPPSEALLAGEKRDALRALKEAAEALSRR